MILKIRIDDRLLHGQVAYSWKSALSYDAIVIVSDSAAKDEMRKTALKLCCPDGVKLATRTVEAGAELLKNPKLKNMRVFVIAPDPETVCRCMRGKRCFPRQCMWTAKMWSIWISLWRWVISWRFRKCPPHPYPSIRL